MPEKALWYNKYTPSSLEDYVWTDPSTKEMIAGWVEKRNIPSVCFAGGPGRGKTSLGWLLINQLAIDSEDYLYLRGSINNNAETVRKDIVEFCELGGWSGLRVVFVDEADALSHVAQGALRNVIDDYGDSVRFIFTCNFPHKIIDALWSSRMIRIDIEKLPLDDFTNRMWSVLEAEGLPLDEDSEAEAFLTIRDLSYPDLRKAINLLQYNVRDGKLHTPKVTKHTSDGWESYFRSILTTQADPIKEIGKIRETLLTLNPEEMEAVYHFLYHNGTELFGDKQIKAILYINAGQKSHRNALLPDMILLEVFLKLMVLMNSDD